MSRFIRMLLALGCLFLFMVGCSQPGAESDLKAASTSDLNVTGLTASYNGLSGEIPGKIEAEDYDEGANGQAFFDVDAANNGGAYRNDAVDIQQTTDEGGGYNVGWLMDGEWLNYTVNIAQEGRYTIAARVACKVNGSTIRFALDGENLGTLNVSPTFDWQNWRTDTLTGITLPAGVHTLTLFIKTGGLNINNLTFIYNGDGETRPWQGIPASVPGKIEAENFDEGPNGDAYLDSDAGNNGGKYRPGDDVDIQDCSDSGAGYNIGWTKNGEWLQYTVDITSETEYDIEVRLASPEVGSLIRLTLDGNLLGNIKVDPATGGWQNWRSEFIRGVKLAGGTRKLVLHVDSGLVNVNYINISETDVFENKPIPVPGKVEAENYSQDPGKTNYFDTSAGNSGGAYRNDAVDIQECTDNGGGYNLGWVEKGEWLAYDINVQAAGLYDIAVRTAGPGNGSVLRFNLDGEDIGAFKAIPTTDWQDWRTDWIYKVNLTGGLHTLKLFIDEGGANINYFDIVNSVAEAEDFTFMVVPDTQFMVMQWSYKNSDYSQYTAQTKWIAGQKDSLNIQFVSHVGDLIENAYKNDWGTINYEFERFKAGWQDIEDSGIPWSILPGNHDSNDNMGGWNWNSFNDYYPASYLLSKPWCMETFPEGRSENSLHFFEASGMEFMVLAIGHNPGSAEWDWANRKLKQYPNKRAILSTHDINAGEKKVVDLGKQNKNVLLIVSGHYNGPEWTNVYYHNEGGGTFREIMSDYQDWNNGYLRYYRFKPTENEIEAVTYHPLYDTFRTGETSNFSWEYDM